MHLLHYFITETNPLFAVILHYTLHRFIIHSLIHSLGSFIQDCSSFLQINESENIFYLALLLDALMHLLFSLPVIHCLIL